MKSDAAQISFVAMAVVCIIMCRGQVAIEDVRQPPRVTAADKDYANVFKPLDGVWTGKFHVYVDKRGQLPEPAQPHELDEKILQQLPLAEELVVDVQQVYESESPYFQRVRIVDRYPDARGNDVTVESYGVNKIQDGKMWCVVIKPDETVVHHGELESQNTIVWQRSLSKPLKIEYFKETVEKDRYTILGWGYYGDDDPALSPRYWFKAKYIRKPQAAFK